MTLAFYDGNTVKHSIVCSRSENQRKGNIVSSISRRDFMGGATLLAATGALGFMAGCSPKTTSDAEEVKESLANTASPDETIDCDILVIGAGASGLAACVEGAEAGKRSFALRASLKLEATSLLLKAASVSTQACKKPKVSILTPVTLCGRSSPKDSIVSTALPTIP